MVESTWNGFKRIDFEFDGKEAILIFPKKPNKNRNWLLKTVYFSAFQDFELEMVERGWHLAYVKNASRWCLEEDLDRKKAFADYLIKEYGLAPKCVPVGMSCGGLMGSKFAAKYPEYVSALYLDAPVMNLLSCPAALGRAEDASMMQQFTEHTGMVLQDLICYREHPIDKMHLLLENKIPVIMVYGNADVVVPYEENGALLERYYRANGGTIVTICKSGCGHHPHGLEDPTPIIDFVEKYNA